jgi:hypothetical protein
MTDITITYHGEFASTRMRYSAGWRNAERRFHVWLDAEGRNQDGVIHSNPIEGAQPSLTSRARSDHRAHSFSAKVWAKVRGEIVRATTPEGLEAARTAWQAAEDARQAGIDEQRRVEAQATLQALWDRGFRPAGWDADHDVFLAAEDSLSAALRPIVGEAG